MQTIPKLSSKNKNVDWFSKIQLLLDSKECDSNIYIIYKYSDILDDMSTIHLLQYLRARYDNIKIYDIEDDAIKEDSIRDIIIYEK